MDKAHNIIFLDMDGVLNSESFYLDWLKSHGEKHKNGFFNEYMMSGGVEGYVVPELVDRFIELCRQTDSLIVWSSSWRANYEIDDNEFNENGIKRLWDAKGLPFDRYIGCTPVIAFHRYSYVPRYLEIMRWLDEHQDIPVNRIAIIDDDYDAWKYDEKYNNVAFFQTFWEFGLTEDVAIAVEQWLNFEKYAN